MDCPLTEDRRNIVEWRTLRCESVGDDHEDLGRVAGIQAPETEHVAAAEEFLRYQSPGASRLSIKVAIGRRPSLQQEVSEGSLQ
jgi:hypothetical protein